MAYLRALSTKAEGWQYEQEVRFIYELPTHSDQLRQDGDLSLIPIPSSAIKEIIVGFNASISMVEQLVNLYRQGSFGDAQLHYTTCHPHLFEDRRTKLMPNLCSITSKSFCRRKTSGGSGNAA